MNIAVFNGTQPDARPFAAVPRRIRLALAVFLLCQMVWHAGRPHPLASAQSLGSAPARGLLRAVSLDEPSIMARWTMLRLQAFDNQPGVSIPFADLDYKRVRQWLQAGLDLDPRSQYPLLAASRVYGSVGDPAKKRLMLDFVYRRFLENPNHRWRWLAHASFVAKHALKDLPLALRYADELHLRATGTNVPFWAKDLKLVLLQEMGEIEAAKGFIAGLLESGQITDENELKFLQSRLDELSGKKSPDRE